MDMSLFLCLSILSHVLLRLPWLNLQFLQVLLNFKAFNGLLLHKFIEGRLVPRWQCSFLLLHKITMLNIVMLPGLSIIPAAKNRRGWFSFVLWCCTALLTSVPSTAESPSPDTPDTVLTKTAKTEETTNNIVDLRCRKRGKDTATT